MLRMCHTKCPGLSRNPTDRFHTESRGRSRSGLGPLCQSDPTISLQVSRSPPYLSTTPNSNCHTYTVRKELSLRLAYILLEKVSTPTRKGFGINRLIAYPRGYVSDRGRNPGSIKHTKRSGNVSRSALVIPASRIDSEF